MSKKRYRNDTKLDSLRGAIARKDLEEVKKLIANVGDDFVIPEKDSEYHPLTVAAKTSTLEIVTVLAESVFGDNAESIEIAYDAALANLKYDIMRYLFNLLPDEDYSDEESDSGLDARPTLHRNLASINLRQDEDDSDEEPGEAHSPGFGVPSGFDGVGGSASSARPVEPTTTSSVAPPSESASSQAAPEVSAVPLAGVASETADPEIHWV